MKKVFKQFVVRILEWEAKRVISRYKPKVVAVVGSVGKTSTKDAIATALSISYRVGKSKKSYNSEFGVPLAILGAESGAGDVFRWTHILFDGFLLGLFDHEYPEILVLEVGADRPGDILRTAGWIKTDVVVATVYGDVPVHIEYFGSREELVHEDREILKTLKPEGTLIVNADDEASLSFVEVWQGAVKKVSLQKGDIVGRQYQIEIGDDEFPEGFSVLVEVGGVSTPVRMHHVLGEQHIYPLLIAGGVASVFDIEMPKAMQALARHETPLGRMKIIKGIHGTCILDDTYNAAPAAVKAGLIALRNTKVKGRKIAVLGDMMELGVHSIEQHKKIGRLAASVCDILITSGVRSMTMANEALEAGMKAESVTHVEDAYKAGEKLKDILKAGDIILVKGSQSMRMERAIEQIMAEPTRKAELLVRQDGEWEGR